MSSPGPFRQSLWVLLLPFNVVVVVPAAILLFGGGSDTRWPLGYPLLIVPQLLGLLLGTLGVWLLFRTVHLFGTLGEGTLAPWDPTRKLVVAGPYRYVRNPMISGVAMTLLGVAVAAGSVLVLAWFSLFVLLNHVYFVLVEEPGLVRRFGDEYVEYRQRVPRWLPRAGTRKSR
jgi:protein-S-isoprenylcysteine O-methyltransferase Ste14